MQDKTKTKGLDLKEVEKLIREAKELIDENNSAKELEAMEQQINNIK